MLKERTGNCSSDMMLWSSVIGKSPQVSTWDQVGIYCQSTAPQHICHVSHRPLRMIVPEACVCVREREETSSSRVHHTSLSKLISFFILCANEALHFITLQTVKKSEIKFIHLKKSCCNFWICSLELVVISFFFWVCWWGTLTEVWGQTEVMKKWMGWGVGARKLENLRKERDWRIAV